MDDVESLYTGRYDWVFYYHRAQFWESRCRLLRSELYALTDQRLLGDDRAMAEALRSAERVLEQVGELPEEGR
jgi:hypothetical protein